MTSVKEFRVDEPATADDLGRGAFVFTDDYSVFDWGRCPTRSPTRAPRCVPWARSTSNCSRTRGSPRTTMASWSTARSSHSKRPSTTASRPGRWPSNSRRSLTSPSRPGATPTTPTTPTPVRTTWSPGDRFPEPGRRRLLAPLPHRPRRPRTRPRGVARRDRRTGRPHRRVLHEVRGAGPLSRPRGRRPDRRRRRRRRPGTVAREVNRVVTEQAAEAGLVHQDGKIECLYYDGEIRVADVVGTFDENRFAYDGQQVSKEVVRQYHKRTQPDWVAAVGEAKERADAEGVADWKSLCEESPEPLDASVIQAARDLYCAGTNAYVGREVFDAPTLDEAVAAVQNL